ncbi:MAG: AAA family ATPase [Desulfobacterota bacterium]|nr:AAA family ATPase [Thermodesulfobacteriota bacterium]
MYRSYYQMQREAFGNLPELNLFFNSRTHQQAWRYLVSGIRAQEPYLLVAGDYGMGKTLLCMMLVRMLKQYGKYPCAYIPDPHTDYALMLAEVAGALGIDTQPGNAVVIHALLNRYFRERQRSEVCYLVIDDAHELEPPVLERLRALTNINNNGRFPFRLVLFAHTVMLDMLGEPTLIALGQRIRSRCLLAPLDLEEVREYIYYRLYKSGSFKAPMFTDDAIQEIFFQSKGIPRLINTLAHACLIAGAEQQLEVISHAVVVAAAQTTGTVTQEQQPHIRVGQLDRAYGETQDAGGALDDAIQSPTQDYSAGKKHQRRSSRAAGAHAAEPARSLTVPVVILSLMILVFAAAAGWEYYRWRGHAEQTDPAASLTEHHTTTVHEAKTLDTEKVPSAPSDSEKLTGGSVQPFAEQSPGFAAPPEVHTTAPAAGSPLQQPGGSEPDRAAIEEGHSSQQPLTETTPWYIISLPPQTSVVTVDIAKRRSTLWQCSEKGISAHGVINEVWDAGKGLVVAGTDPRKGDFVLQQSGILYEGTEKIPLLKRWRSDGRFGSRELVALIVLSGDMPPDELAIQKARELPDIVRAWAEAWRCKDVDRMMSFYSDIVTIRDTDKDKPFVFTKEEMAKRRREVFAKCGVVSLALSDPVCIIDPQNTDTGIVIFSQMFRSETFADEGEKALFLRLEKDASGTLRQWKIVGQLWVPWKVTQLKR